MRAHLARFTLALSLLGALARPAAAVTWPDEEFVALPCRPTVACTADIVGAGMLEIEAGYLARKADGLTHTTPFVVKYSLFSWMQLQVGGNGGVFVEDTRRFDDIWVLGKFRLLTQDDTRPSLALSAALQVPTSDPSDSYQPNTSALFQVYVTKEKGIVHGDVNLGFNVLRVQDQPLLQLWAALAVSVALPHSFTVMGELYGFSDAPPVAQKDAGLLFAVAWAPRPWLVFDVGGDLGLIREVRSFSGFAGLTIIPISFYNRKKAPSPPEQG